MVEKVRLIPTFLLITYVYVFIQTLLVNLYERVVDLFPQDLEGRETHAIEFKWSKFIFPQKHLA
jgi:hypothetical protein